MPETIISVLNIICVDSVFIDLDEFNKQSWLVAR
jgi:hypothetical protein